MVKLPWWKTEAGRISAKRSKAKYLSKPENKARARARLNAYRKTPKGKASRSRNVWKYGLKKRYGITVIDWVRMLIEQAGRCACCGEPMREPVVDHCHKAGHVRGLVHQTCNWAIAAVENWGQLIEPARRYLAR